MSALNELSVLVIEAIPGMRTQLRNMLGMFGVSDIVLAATAGAGVRKVRERTFDLILCEYHLGEGQDGQHLLEDIRHHSLISRSTLFVMVTGERSYERVVSAAELAPDDYILKPFNAENLQERLEKALRKRDAFLPIWRLVDLGALHDAIALCAEGAREQPTYLMDFLRLSAELHQALGNPAEARAIYERVLASKAVPWARLGLARAHFMEKQYEEAESLLTDLIQESDLYLDAYDLLAETREASGHIPEARNTLEKAVRLSPHRLRRLRKLGEIAAEMGDMETAQEHMAEVVRKGKYSDFRDPEDHVHLLRAQLGLGDAERAAATILDMERSMGSLHKSAVCSGLSRALYHGHTGDEEKAREALFYALDQQSERVGLSNRLKEELARACFTQRLDDHGSEVVLEVMRNAPDERSLQKAKTLLEEAGLGHKGEEFAERIRLEVNQLVADGAAKARDGDLAGAVALMREAAQRMPNNPQVLLNAALALLKHIEQLGWSDELAGEARQYLEKARKLDPGHKRIPLLSELFRTLLVKYGIRPTL
jgi:DNA-binding response OmpR family regulator